VSPTCMNSDEAGSFREKLFIEDKGFNPEDGNALVEIDLDDEPGSLLDSQNAW